MQPITRTLLTWIACLAAAGGPAGLAAQEPGVRLQLAPRAGWMAPTADLGSVNRDWDGTTSASPRPAWVFGVDLRARQGGAPFGLALALDVAPRATMRVRHCGTPAGLSCTEFLVRGEVILAGADALIPLQRFAGAGGVDARLGAGAKLYRFDPPCPPEDGRPICSVGDVFTPHETDAALRLGLEARWQVGPAAVTAALTDHVSAWSPNASAPFDDARVQHDLVLQAGVGLSVR